MGDIKLYTNKFLGNFDSIPIKLIDDSSQLDSLYLATYFHKMRTKPVAAIRKSKHYEATLTAWQKKLTDVDTSDLAAVAKTLGFNVEVFNPLASSEPQTSFSGGGRSKRLAQLLKVKKGVYKPMKGGINEDPVNRFNKVMREKNDRGKIREVVFDDKIQVEKWNEFIPDNLKLSPDTIIMRKKKVDLDADGKIPADILIEIRKCAAASNFNDVTINGHTYKDFPICPVSMEEVTEVTEKDTSGNNASTLEYYYYVNPYTTPPNQRQCYMKSSIDKWRKQKGIFEDPLTKKTVVMLEWLIYHARLRSYFIEELRGFVGYGTMPSDDVGYGYEDNTQIDDYDYQFVRAVHDNDVETVRRLFNEGVDLHYAATYGKLELAKLFIMFLPQPTQAAELGFSVDLNQRVREMGNKAPLHTSAMNGHLDLVKVLLNAGADIELKDDDSSTPLHIAATFGRPEVARTLISAGADVHARDFSGGTPLHVSRMPEITNVLIQSGANVNARDEEGATPLHLCHAGGRGAKLLVHAGADVNIMDSNGQTPLHSIAKNSSPGYGLYEQLRVATVLIDSGADVNVKDKKGNVPLHKISELGSLDIAQMLIDAGADVKIKNDRGRTPTFLNPVISCLKKHDDFIIKSMREVRSLHGGGSGGSTMNEDNMNEDEILSEAIQVLFSQMEDLTLKQNLTNKLNQITTGGGYLSKMFGKRKESKAAEPVSDRVTSDPAPKTVQNEAPSTPPKPTVPTTTASPAPTPPTSTPYRSPTPTPYRSPTPTPYRSPTPSTPYRSPTTSSSRASYPGKPHTITGDTPALRRSKFRSTPTTKGNSLMGSPPKNTNSLF